MGVKSCSRNGCESIMCDRYSTEYGYICYSCFDELGLKQLSTHNEIVAFMEYPKNGIPEKPRIPYQFYDELFPE